ncbi:MAG TPA: SDR family NAD(P)-dependent oxidoreductase [Geminicoccus sp.]|uniref:SDR family NAD(P)-dependent oxidoreductase n=1 Tax=Geminicoccus sp. TaxID=2024832 RepID=UPI002E349B7F|nr:SDR family NAD(P)-dependent oxidoreductase [Geminicoccus sp.]HEX2529671.1 SDR family NAD(P)-dependent oxidoreductase [Geminicoccus sp.]
MTRVALVTGASRGIGRAIALGLAREGFDLALNDIEQQNGDLQTLAREIEELGRRSLIVLADVRDKPAVQRMAASMIERLGQVDVLVNNAGILTSARIEDITEQQWDDVFDVNAKGVFLVTQALLPHMRQRRYGRIVNIASVGGKRGGPGQAHYCATKAAVLEFTRVLAMELEDSGITANSICPGIIMTEMGKVNLGSQTDIDKWSAATALRRIGRPDDIVGAACFFASDASAFITGQSLNVCGGLIFDGG